MKFIRLKSATWMVAMALLALPGALVTSCSKEANPTENVEPTNGQLVISVKGIKNSENASLKGSTAGSKGAATTTIQKVYEFSDVDLAVSVGNDVPVKSVNFASKNAGNGLKAALPENAEALNDNAKFVVYFFDADNGNAFVTAAELTYGGAGTVDGLNSQGNYTWVALSYNDADTGPATSNPGAEFQLPENKDVLYANGSIDLAAESNIDIMFGHVYSRIAIELTTIGVFGDITGTPTVGINGLALAAGSLDVLTGDLTPSSTTNAATLSYADFERVDPAFGDQMIAYVYTAPVAVQNVALTLQNLEISHADGNKPRTFFASSPGSTQAISVIPEAGKSHRLTFDIVESALTNGSVRWGRSNLYWRGDNGGLRDYAFYHTNGSRSTADGYFAYGGMKPMQFPTDATKGDPCALVYPAGLWVQPTSAQVNTLTSSEGLLTSVLDLVGSLLGAADPAPGSSTGSGYAQYASAASSSTAFPTESNSLRFYYNGQITNLSLLSAIGSDGEGLLGLGLNSVNVDLAGATLLDLGIEGTGLTLPILNLPILGDSYGVQAAFWSKTGALNIPILASVGSWGYTAYEAQTTFLGIPTGNYFVKATTTAELLSNVDLLGIDLLNTSLKNVRCVRAD